MSSFYLIICFTFAKSSDPHFSQIFLLFLAHPAPDQPQHSLIFPFFHPVPQVLFPQVPVPRKFQFHKLQQPLPPGSPLHYCRSAPPLLSGVSPLPTRWIESPRALKVPDVRSGKSPAASPVCRAGPGCKHWRGFES